MRRTVKVWLWVSAALVLAGCVLFAGVMTMLKWDFSKLSTVKYETNTYGIGSTFTGISVDTNTADVTLLISDNGACKVVCRENPSEKHQVTVEGDTLVVRMVDSRRWYEFIGIHSGSPGITVYLPEKDYRSLRIHGSTGDVELQAGLSFENAMIALNTGDIRISGMRAGSMDLVASTGRVVASDITCEGNFGIRVSTGKTTVTDVRCGKFTSTGNTGDLEMRNLIAGETIGIERTTGDVRMESCDAPAISVKTDTGSVTGSLLSGKVFDVRTDTGRVDVPRSGNDGMCEITTDTGDIRITVEGY